MVDATAVTVRVQGQLVPVSQGLYAVDLPLPTEGPETIVVEAVDAAGHRATVPIRGTVDRTPPLLEAMLASGRSHVYEEQDGRRTAYGPRGVVPVPDRDGVVEVAAVKARGGVRKRNAGASLVDIGDGVALLEFHSKMNALGADAFGMINTAVKEAKAHFDALVIGNQGENFSVGANLMMVLLAVQEEEWDELDASIRQFQNANMALKYADIPVVSPRSG